MIVNMHEAKSTLSSLVEALEQGRESLVVIARNGRPVARLQALEASPQHRRIGVAKGAFTMPPSPDADETWIADLFEAGQ